MIDVSNWNSTLGKKYPITVDDKGWVYGVWYCGTSWQKRVLYGQYPQTFLKRTLALFPGVAESRILHCPSGTLRTGVCLDYHQDAARTPHLRGDAASLPFCDNAFDLVLSDPPYSKEDSKVYGCSPFPMRKFMAESWRVLSEVGYLCVLDTKYPSFHRKKWKLAGLICVVTGFLRATRILSIFQKVV